MGLTKSRSGCCPSCGGSARTRQPDPCQPMPPAKFPNHFSPPLADKLKNAQRNTVHISSARPLSLSFILTIRRTLIYLKWSFASRDADANANQLYSGRNLRRPLCLTVTVYSIAVENISTIFLRHRLFLV